MNAFPTGGPVPFPLTGLALPRGWLDGGLAILDRTGHIREINEAFSSWLGYAPEALRGKPFTGVLASCYPEWEAPLRDFEPATSFGQLTLVSQSSKPRQCFQLEIAQNDSGYFVRLDSVLPSLTDLAEGAWDEYLRSDHARRELFVRMLRAEARLNNLINHWPGIIFSQRADFTFSFVSPQIEDLTGVPMADWQKQPQRFWQVVHESDIEELQLQLKCATQTLSGVTSTYRIRNIKTGRVVYILEHRQAVLTESGLLLGYEGVWLDVTRQTIAEKRLSTASWKEALAVLTMGLAHDFSNVMAGIHALSESFLVQTDPEHPFHEGLSLIKRNSLQASQLVHRIINLHHGKIGERQYEDLNKLIPDLVDLVRKILPRTVEVAVQLSQVPLPLYVDAVEFRQVIINLSLNAADAMPRGGKISFETTLHTEAPAPQCIQGKLPRLPIVRLTVQDTGHGIKQKHLNLIFDPFFTTKAMNKGSGLGLYNALLFVEKHHCAISVETEEGAGTAFHIWLPMSDFTEAEMESKSAQTRRQSLLLVGTTDKLLENTAEFLRLNGYYVVLSSSKDDAAEKLHSLDYQFTGIMALVESHDFSLSSFIHEVRTQRLPVKTILQIVGCNQDEMDTQFLRQADLIISPDMPEDDILEKMHSLFAPSSFGL
jgi:PAS domain S-box-containing protein